MAAEHPIAVHFGAGNIGRGFLGQLYFESGFHTVFVDADAELVDALNASGSYRLEIADAVIESCVIDNLSALHASDIGSIAAALSRAAIASTAVGAGVLPKLAPSFAAGIRRRVEDANERPLNILVCENLMGAAGLLRAGILGELEWPTAGKRFGVADTTIGRMVRTLERERGIPTIRAEAYRHLPVDEDALCGELPPVVGIQPYPNFRAQVEQKLFIHNAAHAGTAYLGWMRRFKTIPDAIEDRWVSGFVDQAMAEVVEALSRRHGIPNAQLESQWAELRRRFANRSLSDTVERVGRDPVRKLGPEERLAGAARMCLDEGVEPEYVGVLIAAALFCLKECNPPAQVYQACLEAMDEDVLIRALGGLEKLESMAELLPPKRNPRGDDE